MRKILMIVCLALSTTSCVLWWEGWITETDLTSYQQSELVQEEELLEVDFELNLGTLEIEEGSPLYTYELDLDYDEESSEPRLKYRRNDKVGHLNFHLGGEGISIASITGTHLNVRLNPNIPLRLNGRTGVGMSEIDLSGMKLDWLRLESGVGKTELFMLEPNRSVCQTVVIRSGLGALEITGLGNFGFRNFEFKGGIGSATLDFSGNWNNVGQVEIEVGVGGVEILLPRSLGAEIQFSKSFLSEISVDGFDNKSEDTYVSDNINRVNKVLRIIVRTGIGRVGIGWI